MELQSNGLWADLSKTGYTRKDLKWINSGMEATSDEEGSYFFEGVKIIKGVVYYDKVYYTVGENKVITRVNK